MTLYKPGSLVQSSHEVHIYLRSKTAGFSDAAGFVLGGTLMTVISVNETEEGSVDLLVYTGDSIGWVYSRYVRFIS
jgi:hypothetical protein